ncbi:hypothetical protein [Zoogloea sp.]|uniref:hypothetical protein n=1 Tax=Zoogloea sp. TaxID=49181 RepID=UPI0035B218FC
MKLHQLPNGTRFEFEGQVYSKTGPMTASTDDGKTRMIPRYAVLRPLEGQNLSIEAPAARQLDEKRVLEAFDQFYTVCRRVVDMADHLALEAARRKFLKSLKDEETPDPAPASPAA